MKSRIPFVFVKRSSVINRKRKEDILEQIIENAQPAIDVRILSFNH